MGASQIEAVSGLIGRLLPAYTHFFRLELIPLEDGRDVFEVDQDGERIVLRGSNGVSLASALHHYLKYTCHCHISWSGVQLRLPERLPPVESHHRATTSYQHRYMYNFCTFSYSMTWWDWERWEREIDWMALHGITMPLALTGNEAIWMAVGRRLGWKEEELLDFLPGPSYLAWHAMGNVNGIGGPIPLSWIEKQRELQQKIVEREREFGMTPVLPGFYGHVPGSLQESCPQAQITRLKEWFGLPGVCFLNPGDPLFADISRAFYEEQASVYGRSGYYAMDLFHEGNAPRTTEGYMLHTAKQVLAHLLASNRDAVWVMQSWSMHLAVVRELPPERVLMLDLFAESRPRWVKTEAFYGKPWIWCLLHNFGGRQGMFGDLEAIVQGPAAAQRNAAKGNMAGIGFAPEAIEENPVVYDLLSEQIWSVAPMDMESWLDLYTERRYGPASDAAKAAWRLLKASVYSGTNPNGAVESVINARPSLTVTKVCNGSVIPSYDVKLVLLAWEKLLESAPGIQCHANFTYDLIDVGREMLAVAARPLYQRMVEAYHRRDAEEFARTSDAFEAVILDLDELTGTHAAFMTGPYIAAAERWGDNEEETRLYRWNARTLISTWWPAPLAFEDYAAKQWSGILKSYYLGRWKQFHRRLAAHLDTLESDTPEVFDSVEFERSIRAWEIEWMNGSDRFDAEPSGDPVGVSRKMFEKYKAVIEAVMSPM